MKKCKKTTKKKEDPVLKKYGLSEEHFEEIVDFFKLWLEIEAQREKRETLLQIKRINLVELMKNHAAKQLYREEQKLLQALKRTRTLIDEVYLKPSRIRIK